MLTEAEVWAEYRKCENVLDDFDPAQQNYWMKIALAKVLQFPLIPVKIDNLDQSFNMLNIRNKTGKSFSNTTEPISIKSHVEWWEKNKDTMIAYCFVSEDLIKLVGYSAIYLKDGKYWSTCAILPEFAGHGYGRFILHFIINQIEGDVWATARKDNPAACTKLHIPSDWEMWKDDGTLLHFHTWKGRK